MAYPVSGRKKNSNMIYSITPDVCWTPIGGSMVPVAYNSIVFMGKSTRTLSHVKDNHINDFNLNARGKKVTGHEAGTGGGVIVNGYKGYAAVIKSTSTVYTDGRPIVRHGDLAMINSPSEGALESQAEWEKI